MVGRQLAVNERRGFSEIDRIKTSVIFGKLLLDDVRLDRDTQVVRLTGQVRRRVVVLIFFESAVAEIAPEDGRHPQPMRLFEGLGHFHDLTIRFRRTEIGGAHCGRSHVVSPLHTAEHDLVEGCWDTSATGCD